MNLPEINNTIANALQEMHVDVPDLGSVKDDNVGPEETDPVVRRIFHKVQSIQIRCREKTGSPLLSCLPEEGRKIRLDAHESDRRNLEGVLLGMPEDKKPYIPALLSVLKSPSV